MAAALSKLMHRLAIPALPAGSQHAPSSETSQSVPLLQLLSRGDPARDHDVCAVPALAAERRGPSLRARHRPLP